MYQPIFINNYNSLNSLVRNKILVDHNKTRHLNIYDVISEKGSFEKFQFSADEINALIKTGLLEIINSRYATGIDVYEEEVVCDLDLIEKLLKETTNYGTRPLNSHEKAAIQKFKSALKLAIDNKSCIYFIL